MAANQPDPRRLISVQSHVVTGYVGNRSATFPLQLLGWEVDVVNTTQLSNHTGYGRFGGMRLDADHLQSVFDGMEKNGLLRYGRMLSGYTPSPSALQVVSTFVTKLRSLSPDLIYLLDPVLGDMGRGFYVDKECLPLYQSLMAQATIICPNQFEAQALAGQEITSLATLKAVIASLHNLGTPNVIVTSVTLPDSEVEKIGAKVKGGMILVGSSYDEKEHQTSSPWCIQFPELEDYFVGVGDLFSALMLGNYTPGAEQFTPEALQPARTSLAQAAERAVAAVQSVLRKTIEQTNSDPRAALPSNLDSLDEAEQRVERVRRRELRLVQSRKEIEEPHVRYTAKWLP